MHVMDVTKDGEAVIQVNRKEIDQIYKAILTNPFIRPPCEIGYNVEKTMEKLLLEVYKPPY